MYIQFLSYLFWSYIGWILQGYITVTRLMLQTKNLVHSIYLKTEFNNVRYFGHAFTYLMRIFHSKLTDYQDYFTIGLMEIKLKLKIKQKMK